MSDYPKLAKVCMKNTWYNELKNKGIEIETVKKYYRKFAEFESPDLNPHNMTELIQEKPELFEEVGVKKCDLPVFQKAYHVNKEEKNTSTAANSITQEQNKKENAEVPEQPEKEQDNNAQLIPRRVKLEIIILNTEILCSFSLIKSKLNTALKIVSSK